MTAAKSISTGDDRLMVLIRSLNTVKNELAGITDAYEEEDTEKAELLTEALDELDDVIDILSEVME